MSDRNSLQAIDKRRIAKFVVDQPDSTHVVSEDLGDGRKSGLDGDVERLRALLADADSGGDTCRFGDGDGSWWDRWLTHTGFEEPSRSSGRNYTKAVMPESRSLSSSSLSSFAST